MAQLLPATDPRHRPLHPHGPAEPKGNGEARFGEQHHVPRAPVCAAPRRAGQMLPRAGEGERRLGAPFRSLWCPPASHLFLHQPRPSAGFSAGPIHRSSLRAAGCTDSLFKKDLVNKQLKKCEPHK